MDDHPKSFRGTQCIRTTYGYNIPLLFSNGLPYMKIKPYSDDDWETLPHIFFTSDAPWDPSIFDSDFNSKNVPLIHAEKR